MASPDCVVPPLQLSASFMQSIGRVNSGAADSLCQSALQVEFAHLLLLLQWKSLAAWGLSNGDG